MKAEFWVKRVFGVVPSLREKIDGSLKILNLVGPWNLAADDVAEGSMRCP